MKKILTSLTVFAAFSVASFAQSVVRDTLEFSQGTSKSLLDMLEGQVSGMVTSTVDGGVNSAVNTYIRGLNAIHSDSQPLIILDGVILSSALNQNIVAFYDKPATSYTSPLNSLGSFSSYDIESIEVLKDISATALYGSKGANGVIIIKTRMPVSEGRSLRWRSNISADFADAKDRTFAPAVSHNHSIGVSYMRKRAALDVSAFYRGTDGVVKGTGSDAGGLSVRFDIKTNPVVWFSFSSYNSVSSMSSMTGPSYLGEASCMLAARRPDLFPGDAVEGWLADYDDDVKDYRSVNSATLTVNIAKGLSLNAAIGADFDSNQRGIWYGNGTSFGKANNGAASVMESTLFNYNARVDISYYRYFTQKHYLKAVLYVDADGNANRFNSMCGYNFFVHDLRAKGLSIMGSDTRLNKFQRSYGEMGAGAVARYDFNGCTGIDASLSMGYTPKYDDRPVLFPAVSAYCDIRKCFFPEFEAVSSLRLTAGYGAAGREYYIPYELTGNYYTGAYPSVHPGAEPFYDSLNRLYSREWNAGVEAGFIGGRLNLAVRYYDKTTVDRYSMFCFGAYSDEAELWAYTKRTNAFSNQDRIRNAGVEMDIDATLIESGDWRWTARANAAFNANMIVGSNGENVRGKALGGGIFVNANVKGHPVSSFFGYQEDGSGGYVDNFADGSLDDLDKVVLSRAFPSFTGALGTTLAWRDLAVDVQMGGVAGSHIANLGRMFADGTDKFSSSYIESGDYLRLSRLTVTYDLRLGKRFIRDIRFTLSGNNLFTATKYGGWRPDVNCFGSSTLSYGVDYGSYPSCRSILLGIGVNF